MKKKVLIVVGIIVLLILLFPVKYRVKDGGTIIYHAIAYEVIDWHAMMDAPDTPSNVNIYLEGCEVRIFGIPVYDNSELVTYIYD